jgi:ATP-dependent exoDNAse (exonuclease V) beta subunit
LGSFEYNISSSDNSNNSYLNKIVPQVQNKHYKLSPSTAKALSNVKVELTATLHDRLKANNKDAREMGNALHQSLYLKDKSYFEENLSLNKVFDRFEINKNQFVENTTKFNSFLDETYKPIKQYPECHLEQIIGKQLAKGEADLVLETEDSLILIDYKSYPGDEDVTDKSSEFFAGKYSGQLTLYKQMLEDKFNKPVIKQLIYYVVLGKVVEITLHN